MNSGLVDQPVRSSVQTLSPYHQFIRRSGSLPNTDGSPGASATSKVRFSTSAWFAYREAEASDWIVVSIPTASRSFLI